MSKYKIWNGTDTVFTFGPPYKFTPEQWKAKYPWSEVDPCVLSGEGVINGALCMPLSSMVARASAEGCDFSQCVTDQDKLDAIEAFEKAREAAAAEASKAAAESEAVNAEMTATALNSIAASMEYQNMMTLEDVEV